MYWKRERKIKSKFLSSMNAFISLFSKQMDLSAPQPTQAFDEGDGVVREGGGR